MLKEVANTLKDMQKPCSASAGSGDMNERMKQVEEVLGKLVNDVSVITTKLTDVKEDLNDNRQYTTTKYDELMVKTNALKVETNELMVEANDNQETANSKYHELRQSYEDLAEMLGKRNEKSGTTYVRWGRKTCPDGTETVYTGYAGGSHYASKGAAVSMLCLPTDPEWQMHSNSVDRNSGLVFGAEYDPDPRIDQFFENDLGQQDVPCAVCNNRLRSSSIMIPGKTSCHAGWNMEYSGYLMSGYWNHNAATDYYCVDNDAKALTGGAAHQNGKLLYLVEARCGSLKCPPYKNGWELACVVCSK